MLFLLFANDIGLTGVINVLAVSEVDAVSDFQLSLLMMFMLLLGVQLLLQLLLLMM